MTGERWHADIEVTDELVSRKIVEQFPEMAPLSSIQCIGEGWDNKAYMVNNTYIFRFPRRKIAVELIERENAILRHLQPIVSLAIPQIQFYGKPTPDYPYVFHGYKKIKGVSGCYAALTPQQRSESIIPLAQFIKEIHQFSEHQAQKIGAKEQLFDRTNVARILNVMRENIKKIDDRNIVKIQFHHLKKELKRVEDISLSGKKVLIHGDLYCRHLMFHKGRLNGIIDWGDVGINNPSVDLAVIFSFYEGKEFQSFFNIYGQVDKVTWDYSRFLGLYSAFSLLLYGYDIHDKLLVEEAKQSIKRINEKVILL